MKIIILEGGKHTGKSTTISHDFYNWLLANGAQTQVIHLQTPKELEGVFSYKNMTIAVHSRGDLYQWVVFAIVKYVHCDYLVLAGSTYVQSTAKLIAQIRANPHNCVITKQAATNADNQRACNDIIAAI